MAYTEVSFKILPYNQNHEELLIASLEEKGFDSFWQDDGTLKAYIPTSAFSAEILTDVKKQFEPSFTFNYFYSELPDKNWNEEWEKNFNPILINNKCLVRAPFHSSIDNLDYEIIIEPKMSFGTGHHSTTSQMMELLLETEILGKNILDMGCGTGILSILASKMMAKKVVAIDNDSWAFENSVENINKNNCKNIEVILGNVQAIQSLKFDIILANINRNIILEDMDLYVSSLNRNGMLFLSGFLSVDREIVLNKAMELNLLSVKSTIKNDWVAEVFIKKG